MGSPAGPGGGLHAAPIVPLDRGNSLADCLFCGNTLGSGHPARPEPGRRLAYDPWLGRLWEICGSCRRWNPVPLALRWETLEACEEAVRTRGRIRVASDNLSLVTLGDGEVVRVGSAPRVELAGWRYGERLPDRPAGGFWARVLSQLPSEGPLGGYDVYRLGGVAERSLGAGWLASPFLAHANKLTLAFTSLPFARACPSCNRPLLLEPSDFQRVRWVLLGREPGLLARCALCGDEVAVPTTEARPALRLGLSLVTPDRELRPAAEPAAREVEAVGGGRAYVERLAGEGVSLGELELSERVGLAIVLDEAAELEALESEWREAEEIAAIMDGELADIPGFEDFRARVLGA